MVLAYSWCFSFLIVILAMRCSGLIPPSKRSETSLNAIKGSVHLVDQVRVVSPVRNYNGETSRREGALFRVTSQFYVPCLNKYSNKVVTSFSIYTLASYIYLRDTKSMQFHCLCELIFTTDTPARIGTWWLSH